MENFICADASKVNLWNLERSKDSVYNLVDYNRRKTSDDDELITKARFSPASPMFLYTTSTGLIRVCDMRESSNFHSRASVEFSLAAIKPNRQATAFDRWLLNVSDACFVPGSDTQIVSRDYLHTCMWDMRLAQQSGSQGMIVDTPQRARPIYQATVTDYMTNNLVNLYDNDSLDDQFFVDVSPDGKYLASGAYNKSGHVMDINFTQNQAINCRFNETRDASVGTLKVYDRKKRLISNPSSPAIKAGTKANRLNERNCKVDMKKRVQLGAWKPTSQNEVAN